MAGCIFERGYRFIVVIMLVGMVTRVIVLLDLGGLLGDSCMFTVPEIRSKNPPGFGTRLRKHVLLQPILCSQGTVAKHQPRGGH
jgi:hypothetical protein